MQQVELFIYVTSIFFLSAAMALTLTFLTVWDYGLRKYDTDNELTMTGIRLKLADQFEAIEHDDSHFELAVRSVCIAKQQVCYKIIFRLMIAAGICFTIGAGLLWWIKGFLPVLRQCFLVAAGG